MSLKVLLKDQNGNISRVYLKKEDIDSIVFGTDVIENPNYKELDENENQVESNPENTKTIDVKFCRINFYRKVEVKEPYESVKRVNGKEKTEIKERIVSVNDYWAIFDTAQFDYIEKWAEENL